MNYEEEYIISLFARYRDSFEHLNKTMHEADLYKEYGRGGATLHRGFYCPSPVEDIIIGGCDRGRLVRNPKSELPVDYIYLKEGDRLKIVDKYALTSDNTSVLSQREFIVDVGAEVVAPIYRMTWNPPMLSFISLCRYDSAGRIIKYITFFLSNGPFVIDSQKSIFYAEQYTYDEQTGLLESVISGDKYKEYISEYSYRFFHDEAGCLVTYQNIETGTIREIAKKKQRMI